MAVVTVEATKKVMRDAPEIQTFLAQYGIWYRRLEANAGLTPDATAEQVLEAYAEPIRRLKAEGGYVSADVIDIHPDTPNLQMMLDKFNKEHTHDEDEVRFVAEGRGVFHINPAGDPVFRIEVHAGDMINVPRGTQHWFDLCDDSRIRAVRLFQDTAGWTPHYTGSGEETQHEPLCFGPNYLPSHLIKP